MIHDCKREDLLLSEKVCRNVACFRPKVTWSFEMFDEALREVDAMPPKINFATKRCRCGSLS